MFAQMQDILSSKSTRFNPYYNSHKYKKSKPAEVEMKSCIFAREYVIFVLHGFNYPAGIVFA